MMRFGCGCLLALLCVAGLFLAARWTTARAMDRPDFPVSATTADDGRRAQAKIYEVVSRRGAGRSPTTRPAVVVLTEQELNAFVAHHLVEVDRLPVADVSLRLPGTATVDLAGRLPVDHVLAASVFASLRTILPTRWAAERIWIVLGATVRVESGGDGRRWLRLDVKHLAIGRQQLPAFLARLVLDPAVVRWLRWPLPAGIEEITVETGRVLIRLAG